MHQTLVEILLSWLVTACVRTAPRITISSVGHAGRVGDDADDGDDRHHDQPWFGAITETEPSGRSTVLCVWEPFVSIGLTNTWGVRGEIGLLFFKKVVL